MPKHMFSVFDVSRQVFFKSPLSLGIVNLKPLIPGHVLVLPQRVVPRLADLKAEEVSDLFIVVQAVGRVIERAYKAQALTISLQDGAAAGQSVPHVHVHILPRSTQADFGEDKDSVYPALEGNEAALQRDMAAQKKSSERFSPPDVAGAAAGAVGQKWAVQIDEYRRPRSEEEMEKEAQWLSTFFG